MLKLNAYLMAICDEQERCSDCPFINHEKAEVCLLTYIRKKLRALYGEAYFDIISDEKYTALAEDVSLEEIKLELGDFADEYCEGTTCDNCCFHSIAVGRCSLCAVEKILQKIIDSP